MTILAGFIAGFAGSVHCVVMCGGLVGVISASMQVSFRRAIVYWCSYHFGRILSYTIAGIVVGGLAGQVANLFPMHRAHVIGAYIAGLFLVILGGHVAQWWNLLNAVEKAGGNLWQRIVPSFSKILPPRLHRHAIIGGLLWGWIPCGLVYSTIVLAATTADPVSGGLTMFAFGVGTLPMLFAMGALANQMERLKQLPWLKGVMGSALCVFGALILLGVVPLGMERHGM